MSAEFESTIPAGDRPQTDALDRAATGTDKIHIYVIKLYATLVYFAPSINPFQSPLEKPLGARLNA